jgi:hypothetical protein
VWTAVREDALELALPDGRKLMIGGEVADFGDEYADPWVYNDVVVTHADGTIDILAYPKEVFPHLYWPAEAIVADDVYIFGTINRKHHSDRPRAQVGLRLDTSSYEIADLSPPPVWLSLYKGCAVRDGSRIVLPVMRDYETDPEMDIAFDLETLTWSEPFPHPVADWKNS